MSLRGFTNISDSTLTNDIRNNIVSFFDYGLLEKGNFINVSIPGTGYYGGQDYRLRPVSDPRYSGNRVFQAFRQNWVWESGHGALVNSGEPRYPGVSGIYIGSGFYPPSTTGTYSYTINHPMGQVLFANSIPATAVVQTNYSYKYINVTNIGGLRWFEEVHARSEHSESQDFIKQSGSYGGLALNRTQLPAIGIEVVGERSFKPFQLGGQEQRSYTTLRFHCVAEDEYLRDHLVDIVSLQNDIEFRMFNLNRIAESGKFPLNYQGVPISGALRYPDLVTDYPNNYGLRLFDMRVESMYTLGSLFIGAIKCNTEVIV